MTKKLEIASKDYKCNVFCTTVFVQKIDKNLGNIKRPRSY